MAPLRPCKQASVMSHVDNIEGALLLVHGLVDENVHFRHTARLTQARARARAREREREREP